MVGYGIMCLMENQENETIGQYQFLSHGSWDVVAPKNLSEEEIGNVISDLEPVVEKAMRMGPVRRKLHSLRTSFGRWVYDQKNKHRYNAALKRGEISSTLTAEETEQLRAAFDNALSTQGLSPTHTDDGRVASTGVNNDREM